MPNFDNLPVGNTAPLNRRLSVEIRVLLPLRLKIYFVER